MKAFTDKSKVIDTIGDRVGGESRPPLFASSSSRRQHLPAPPRQEMRGTNGSSYFGCARYGIRMIERSRRTMQSPQYAPNDSTRVGADRSVGRGRVLSQSLLVARERRRRELGSNLVIDTIALTSGEGHVVEVGISRRVRKILAGVPASVVIRDLILTLSLSRAERQSWTVGNRPIRKNDLRSLHRNSVEAQIQDRSRQKTGLNTVPGFLRVSNPTPPSLCEGGRERSEQGDARKPPPPPQPQKYPLPQQRVPGSASNHPSPSEGEIKRGLPVRAQGGAGPTTTQTTTPNNPSTHSWAPTQPNILPTHANSRNPISKPIPYHSNHTNHDPANYP